jgi:hypothetical protein
VSPEVNEIVEKIVGQPCVRKEVGSLRSISLGFGEESTEPRRRKRRYRLWEIGTYSADWRILDGATVALAKRFSPDVGELDASLASLHLGRFASIEQLSKSAVRMNLDNGFAVEFFGDPGDDDEYFHIFCPHDVYIVFSDKGWQLGRSDVPWTASAPL